MTQEQKQWLITIGWKNKTISQLAEHMGICARSIRKALDENGIEPITRREIIAKELLIIYSTGKRLSITELAEYCDCSAPTVKEICDEYGLETPKPGRIASAPIAKKRREEEAIARQNLIRLIEGSRSVRVSDVYTQSGSQVLDELRGIKTCDRPTTLLTNFKNK